MYQSGQDNRVSLRPTAEMSEGDTFFSTFKLCICGYSVSSVNHLIFIKILTHTFVLRLNIVCYVYCYLNLHPYMDRSMISSKLCLDSSKQSHLSKMVFFLKMVAILALRPS